MSHYHVRKSVEVPAVASLMCRGVQDGPQKVTETGER